MLVTANGQYLTANGQYLDGDKYGPELILNGGFDDNSNWVIVAGWSIADGKANYLDTVSSYMYQNIALPINTQYKIEFDVSCSTSGSFMFAKTAGGSLFNAPHNNLEVITNGHYNWSVTTIVDSTMIRLTGNIFYDAYSIDNVSLKRYLIV